jgi:hypothetical protein
LELAERGIVSSFLEARNLTDFDRQRIIGILNEKAAGLELKAKIDKAMGR